MWIHVSKVTRLAASGVRTDLSDAGRMLWASALRDGAERQLVVQIIKSVVAAVVAWLIAIYVLEVRQPFVAPMIALLMVQPTLVQSLVKGTQQVAAIIVGMVTALVVFELVDNTTLALGTALLVTTAFGTWRRLGDQGIYAPIVALTMITVQSVGETYLYRRLLETLVGVVIGAAVNFAVKPPRYLDSARASATSCIDDLTGILCDTAQGLRSGWDTDDARDWGTRADRLGAQVESCLEDVGWAGQSIRLNPGRRTADTATPMQTYRPVIQAVGSVAEPLKHLTRTLAICADDDGHTPGQDTGFLTDCAELLDDVAEDIADWANAHTPTRASVRTQEFEDHLGNDGERRLTELADRVRRLPRNQVTYAGAMLIAIEQILDALRQRQDERAATDT